MSKTDNVRDDRDAGRVKDELKPSEPTGKKCREWGENLDIKFKALEKKIPRPLNALLDALCITVIIAAAAWACAKIGWIDGLPARGIFALVFCSLFALSLIYRLLLKPRK